MSEITSIDELTGFLGTVLTAPSPLAELEAKGFRLSPELQEKIKRVTPAKKLSPQGRLRLVQEVKKLNEITFKVRPLAPTAHSLPEGEFDFIGAVRLRLINDVLTGLFAAQTIPQELPQDQVAGLFTLSRLRDFSEDVPEAGNIQIGELHLTASPEVLPVDQTDHVIIRLPFSLDLDQVVRMPPPLSAIRKKVASLDGVLRFGVVVDAIVEEDRILVILGGWIGGPIDEEKVHIEVAITSPLQPRSAEALADLEATIDDPLRIAFSAALREITETWSICPSFRLPIGGDINIQRVEVRAVSSPDGGVLVIGALLGFGSTPDTGVVNTDRLRNPFNLDQANVYARIHEELLHKIGKRALESGELERIAREVDDDLRVDDIEVNLKPNELRISVYARAVDVCGVFPFTFKDLAFRATKILRFTVFDGEIIVTEDNEIDLDNSDVALCLITAGLELILAAMLGKVDGFVLDLIRQIRHFTNLRPSTGDSGKPFEVISAVFDPQLPVPGTELLPRVEVMQSRVDEDAVQSNGAITLRNDDINTYVYVAFLRRVGIFRTSTEPISGARVRLVDQDVPTPSRDDVRIPMSEVKTEITDRFEVTVTTSFRPPRRDQVLAVGETNSKGQVKFLLTPRQVTTTAGTIITTTVTERLDVPNPEPEIRETETPLEERSPDIFFRVEQANGSTFDTRFLDGGFILNLRSKRVGSAEAPLTFTLGGPPIVIG